MTHPFDPKKPVQTRDGRKARIIATDLKGESPIAVAIQSLVDTTHEFVGQRKADGSYGNRLLHGNDIINIPEVDTVRSSEEQCRAGAYYGHKYVGIIATEYTDGILTKTYLIPWEKD